MKFEEGQLAILNNLVIHGLPNRVGEVVEVLQSISSPNYQYLVRLENEEIVPVREKELNEVTEEQLQLMTYIKRGNRVLYVPLNEEVVIQKIDLLHGHIEVEFLDAKAMAVVGIEALKPIEQKEETEVKREVKFKIGDNVKANSKDQWDGKFGIVSGFEFEDDTVVYQVDVENKIGVPFTEDELERVNPEDVTREVYFELLFGHFENEDGTYTVPKQLLHNLLNKIL